MNQIKTADDLWKNEKLMSLNAELGLSMDALVKIADAMQSQARQTGRQWKPIETAPKDFITVFDGWNGERVTDVFWGHPDYAKKGVYDWVKSEYVQGFGNEYQRVANLTHWMQRPPAPEVCSDGGKCGAGGYCITCHNAPAPEGGDK